MKFQQYITEKEIDIIIKSPGEMGNMIDDFVKLVREGGQTDPSILERIVQNCKLLGIAYDGEKPIASIAIKNPLKSYKTKVFTKAGVPEKESEYQYEIGYLYVKPTYRRTGIAKNLFKELLSKIGTKKLYGTAKVDNSKALNLFKEIGFKSIGNQFDSYLGDYKLRLGILSEEFVVSIKEIPERGYREELYPIFKNPSLKEMSELSKDVRLCIDFENEDFYIWDVNVLHDKVFKKLWRDKVIHFNYSQHNNDIRCAWLTGMKLGSKVKVFDQYDIILERLQHWVSITGNVDWIAKYVATINKEDIKEILLNI